MCFSWYKKEKRLKMNCKYKSHTNLTFMSKTFFSSFGILKIFQLSNLYSAWFCPIKIFHHVTRRWIKFPERSGTKSQWQIIKTLITYLKTIFQLSWVEEERENVSVNFPPRVIKICSTSSQRKKGTKNLNELNRERKSVENKTKVKK